MPPRESLDHQEHKQRWFDWVADSVLVKMAIAVLMIVHPVMNAFFHEGIAHSWPFLAPWPGRASVIVWPAVAFWGCPVIGFILYGGREWTAVLRDRAKAARNSATDAARDLKQKELLERVRLQTAKSDELAERNEALRQDIAALGKAHDDVNKRLIAAAETLPTKDFRGAFARKAEYLQRLTTDALRNKPDTRRLGKMIRRMLSDVAQLARVYGSGNSGGADEKAVYKAHVMVFANSISQNDAKSLALVPDTMSYGDYRGALVLHSELSATMDSPSPDDSLKGMSLVLGIPHKDKVTLADALAIAPGPQLAFAGNEVSGIADIEKSHEWNEVKVHPAVVKAFQAWVSLSPFKGSLVSFGLAVTVRRTTGKEERDPVGVMTIYSDQSNVMGGDKERWHIFEMIMQPYVNGIATLLDCWLRTMEGTKQQ